MTDDAPLLAWRPPSPPRFGGASFDADRDGPRLNKQAQAVYDVMKAGAWFMPQQLEAATGYSWASISARVRDFRKPEFNVTGAVERQYLGNGLFQYRLVLQSVRAAA